jgi:hypothetical protein
MRPADISSILVPLDGSDEALDALPHAARLAQANRLSMTLLYACPEAIPNWSDERQQLHRWASGARCAAHAAAEHVFRRARDLLEDYALCVTEELFCCGPNEALLCYARSHPEALVIRGSWAATGRPPSAPPLKHR